jgi:hypothetical protein
MKWRRWQILSASRMQYSDTENCGRRETWMRVWERNIHPCCMQFWFKIKMYIVQWNILRRCQCLDHITLNCRIVMNWKRFGRKRSWPNQGVIMTLAWRDWRNHERPVRITGVPAEIRKELLGRYRSTSLLSLRVFESRVLRKIFWPKRNDMTEIWTELHNRSYIISTFQKF